LTEVIFFAIKSFLQFLRFKKIFKVLSSIVFDDQYIFNLASVLRLKSESLACEL